MNKTQPNQKAKNLYETINKCTYIKSLLNNYGHLQQYLSTVNPNFVVTQFLTCTVLKLPPNLFVPVTAYSLNPCDTW